MLFVFFFRKHTAVCGRIRVFVFLIRRRCAAGGRPSDNTHPQQYGQKPHSKCDPEPKDAPIKNKMHCQKYPRRDGPLKIDDHIEQQAQKEVSGSAGRSHFTTLLFCFLSKKYFEALIRRHLPLWAKGALRPRTAKKQCEDQKNPPCVHYITKNNNTQRTLVQFSTIFLLLYHKKICQATPVCCLTKSNAIVLMLF